MYEPSLSYALLSSLSVDQILTNDESVLQTKYDNALETRQRTDGEIFTNDLNRLRTVITLFSKARRLGTEYLTSEDAVFPKVLDVVGTMNKDVFGFDMETLLGPMKTFQSVYTKIYNEPKSLLFSSAEVFGRTLKEMGQALYLTSHKNQVHQYLRQTAQDGIMQSIVQKETLEIIMTSLKNTTIAVGGNSADLAFMPIQFYKEAEDCNFKMTALMATFNMLTNDFRQMESTNNVGRLRVIGTEFTSHVNIYNKESGAVEQCLEEYPGAVADTVTFLEAAKTDEDSIDQQLGGMLSTFDYIKDSMDSMESDLNNVQKWYEDYMYGLITKMTLLKEVMKVDAATDASSPTTSITTFTSRVKSRLSDPLRQLIEDTKKSLGSRYTTAMSWAKDLSCYLEQYYFYDLSVHMKLWREPIPNIEVPKQLVDNGTELWKVWDRATDIKEFVPMKSTQVINRILEKYFGPLLDEIDKFGEQLVTVESQLLAAVDAIDKEYKKYTNQRKIDHYFVR